MAQISARARAALLGALSARFNPLLSALAGDYGVDPFTLDFISVPKSQNVFLGAIDPSDLEATTVYKLPVLAVYTSASVNQRKQLPATFAGIVRMGADVALSWRGGSAQQDFESLGDAIEDVMNQIANELAQAGWVVTMSMDRSPVKRGQQNWYQLLRFSFLFEVLA